MSFSTGIELADLKEIARQRAEAMPWDAIAEAHCFDETELRRSVERNPLWEQLLVDARTEALAGAVDAAVAALRRLLKSADEKISMAAATQILRLYAHSLKNQARVKSAIPSMLPPEIVEVEDIEAVCDEPETTVIQADEQFGEETVKQLRKYIAMGKLSVADLRNMAATLPQTDGAKQNDGTAHSPSHTTLVANGRPPPGIGL